MYRNCKATEDKDMTPIDFLTDHLINIDCLFDKHGNGDEQKPHAPYHFHHQKMQNYYSTQEFKATGNNISISQTEIPIYKEHLYRSNYLSLIFRPPIV